MISFRELGVFIFHLLKHISRFVLHFWNCVPGVGKYSEIYAIMFRLMLKNPRVWKLGSSIMLWKKCSLNQMQLKHLH
jgi:hypothetical protein